MKRGYKKTIELDDNELPAAVNAETGELRVIKKRTNNIPEGKITFGIKEIGWRKSFDHSWDFLEEKLTDLELRVVAKLSRMAKMNTNSLEPLGDATTLIEIAETFSIDHRRTNKIFKKLFNLGVYAKFEIAEKNVAYTKFWILNPYLSFGGSLINSDIAELFKKTELTKEYYRRINEKK